MALADRGLERLIMAADGMCDVMSKVEQSANQVVFRARPCSRYSGIMPWWCTVQQRATFYKRHDVCAHGIHRRASMIRMKLTSGVRDE